MGKVFDSYVWLGEGELKDYDVIKKVIFKRNNLIVSIYKDKFSVNKILMKNLESFIFVC